MYWYLQMTHICRNSFTRLLSHSFAAWGHQDELDEVYIVGARFVSNRGRN